jgi:hypothetical protein
MTVWIIVVMYVVQNWSSETLLVHGTEATEVNDFYFFSSLLIFRLLFYDSNPYAWSQNSFHYLEF